MAKAAVIEVEWGYELHRLVLVPRNWSCVKSGKPLSIRGKGYWYEGSFYWDYWDFGGGLDGTLTVEYSGPGGDESDIGTGFEGKLTAASIEEFDYRPSLKKQKASPPKSRTWSDNPEVFLHEISSRLQGPYDELLDAVTHLHELAAREESTTGSAWRTLEASLFGDPARFFEQHNPGEYRFGASLMDGPNPDVFEIAGLPWTEELNDGVWGETNWRDLLDLCRSVDVDEEYSLDEMPGQSDTYYWCEVRNPQQFARELRVAILELVVTGNA